MRERWDTPWVSLTEFVGHIVAGTVLFIVIAILAVIIDLILKYLPTIGITNNFILWGLGLAKKALFGADLLLFLIYLVNTSWHFLGTMKWR
jgi:hypothetical protein